MTSSIVTHLETGSYPIDWPGHWIGSRWKKPKKGSEEKISLNPGNGKPLLQFTTSREIIHDALNNSGEIFSKFREKPFADRLDILNSFVAVMGDWQDSLIRAQQVEIGKPGWEARADFEAALRYLDWVAKNGPEIRKSLLAPANFGHSQGEFRLHPVGVTFAYLPFSSPLTSFVFYLCGAMLAGCPLVLFSSTQSSLCGLIFAKMTEQLQLPGGIVNFVFGSFTEFNSVLSNDAIQAVIYTGSKEHCEQLRKDYRGIGKRQLILQSGGKNAALVHSTADLDKAIHSVMLGGFKSAGQLCSSTSRVFVFRSLLPEFKEKLYKAVTNMSIGPVDQDDSGKPPGPFMGPLYSKKAVEKFLRFQTMGHRDAEETILWGRELELDHGGFFVSPGIHLMKDFDPSSAYQNNILFSPDLAIYSYDVLQDAIDWVNVTEACQSVAFFGDPDILKDRCHLLYAPNLMVNVPSTEIEATLPLAGRSRSGHHRYHGPGLALYLCYPQAFRDLEQDQDVIRAWPNC